MSLEEIALESNPKLKEARENLGLGEGENSRKEMCEETKPDNA